MKKADWLSKDRPWVSPEYAFRKYEQLKADTGLTDAEIASGGAYKRVRECLAAACLAVEVRTIVAGEAFLLLPDEDPPDAYILCESDQDHVPQITHVEITEHRGSFKRSLREQLIDTKLKFDVERSVNHVLLVQVDEISPEILAEAKSAAEETNTHYKVWLTAGRVEEGATQIDTASVQVGKAGYRGGVDLAAEARRFHGSDDHIFIHLAGTADTAAQKEENSAPTNFDGWPWPSS